MYSIENILDKVQAYLPDINLDLIRRSYLYAYEAHKDQKRKSGIDFIQHPLATADLLATMRMDIPSICAALLHDVREDAPDRTRDLSERFGPEIAFIVEGVTKLKKYQFTNKQERQAESFKKMLIAMSKDIRVLLVKLADRVNNMREMEYMPPEKQKEISLETLKIYAPLADRLGISWIRTELEDLSFKYLMTDEYDNLKKQCEIRVREKGKFIRQVIDIITDTLKKGGLTGFEVTGRQKHLYGIYRKMKNQNVPFDKVYDFVAFRIILQYAGNCWLTIGFLHSLWTPIPGRLKDFINVPKPNGYQSLHTTVIGPGGEPIEIQVRTWDMHQIAESGVASHWKYKEGGEIDMRDEQKFRWLKQLLDWAKEFHTPEDFMDSLTTDLFTDEIYLFTPRGDLKILQKGATPVDFAYEIHTELGHQCSGAKVNGQIVPLSYQLKSGEIVEIITRSNQKPHKDWLNFVISSRAKNKIRAYFHDEERVHSIGIGRELFEKDIKKNELDPKKVLGNKETVQKILSEFKCSDMDEIYMAIGQGRLKVSHILRAVLPESKEDLDNLKINKSGRITDIFRTRKEGIAVDGVEDMMLHLAKCCNPIPGDDITGFVTRGRGVSIHRSDCDFLKASNPERFIQAYWTKGNEGVFNVPVRIACINEKGILAKITKEISDQNSNISSINANPGYEHKAELVLIVDVKDLKQLNDVLRGIRKLKSVLSVERIRKTL
jgi:GTP pyrophosphokinase